MRVTNGDRQSVRRIRSSQFDAGQLQLYHMLYLTFFRMPNTHDSVNDARKALECVEYWIQKDGNVEPIERTSKNFEQLFC